MVAMSKQSNMIDSNKLLDRINKYCIILYNIH